VSEVVEVLVNEYWTETELVNDVVLVAVPPDSVHACDCVGRVTLSVVECVSVADRVTIVEKDVEELHVSDDDCDDLSVDEALAVFVSSLMVADPVPVLEPEKLHVAVTLSVPECETMTVVDAEPDTVSWLVWVPDALCEKD
jgi:hypothetical protein